MRQITKEQYDQCRIPKLRKHTVYYSCKTDKKEFEEPNIHDFLLKKYIYIIPKVRKPYITQHLVPRSAIYENESF